MVFRRARQLLRLPALPGRHACPNGGAHWRCRAVQRRGGRQRVPLLLRAAMQAAAAMKESEAHVRGKTNGRSR